MSKPKVKAAIELAITGGAALAMSWLAVSHIDGPMLGHYVIAAVGAVCCVLYIDRAHRHWDDLWR